MSPDAPTPCAACNGTGILDFGDYTENCPECLDDGFCPRCDADNSNVVYVDSDDCTWAWDGETPCPACGWTLEVQP
jgi:hypothetical protein